MNATRQLARQGQSLWLDNITRDHLNGGVLQRYIDEWSVTGLTSNPTIFEQALKNSTAYDDAIRDGHRRGLTDEELFFELALEDLTRAADLFRPVHDKTRGVDGWVSLEVSPLLARDAAGTLTAARTLFARAGRPNLFIKIPGTPEGLPAIEEAIFAGVPVNVTLLFSREQYRAAAGAYRRGIERRVEAGLDPWVESVASVFISRWDGAVAQRVPLELKNRLGVAIARRTHKAAREELLTDSTLKILNAGGRPQRLLWASTGRKDPQAPDLLYVHSLVAPFTVNTMPEPTLRALAHSESTTERMPPDGGDCEDVLARFAGAGIDIHALADALQTDGADAFVKSWNNLLAVLADKRRSLGR